MLNTTCGHVRCNKCVIRQMDAIWTIKKTSTLQNKYMFHLLCTFQHLINFENSVNLVDVLLLQGIILLTRNLFRKSYIHVYLIIANVTLHNTFHE